MLVTPQLVSHTLTNLDEANDDDENEREKLGCSKEVLHPGGRLHAVAVHECQQDCREEVKKLHTKSHKTYNSWRTAKAHVLLQVFLMLLFVLRVGPPFTHPGNTICPSVFLTTPCKLLRNSQ